MLAFGNSIYDITDYVKIHKGGSEKTILSDENNLVEFFALYPFEVKEDVENILARNKIGELHSDDCVKEESIKNLDSAHFINKL